MVTLSVPSSNTPEALSQAGCPWNLDISLPIVPFSVLGRASQAGRLLMQYLQETAAGKDKIRLVSELSVSGAEQQTVSVANSGRG